MRITDKFENIVADLSPIGLIRNKNYGGYLCTPLNAVVFANIGCDGIHFCILPDEKDLPLENSPVYVISPMMPDHYVESVADNFLDFLSLVVSVKDATVLECISYTEREGFLELIQSISHDDPEIKKAVEVVTNIFHVREISDVYSYVKQVQAKTDLSGIQFSKEYHDLIG